MSVSALLRPPTGCALVQRLFLEIPHRDTESQSNAALSHTPRPLSGVMSTANQHWKEAATVATARIPVAIWTPLFPPCFVFEFICIRPSLLAVKCRVALYVNPVVGFRRGVAAEAVLLVVSRDLIVRCIGFK